MSNLSLLHKNNRDHTNMNKFDSEEFPLTAREKEVQVLITNGMTNKMIAKELGITEGTAKNHVKNLMRKLNAHSRLEVALIALGNSVSAMTI